MVKRMRMHEFTVKGNMGNLLTGSTKSDSDSIVG